MLTTTTFDSKQTFPITKLELYAKCPYKYFLAEILNVNLEEEVEVDITRREMGMLLHLILKRFLLKIKSESRDFYAELNSNFMGLEKELFEIAQEEIEERKTIDPYFFLVEEFFLGSEQNNSVLTQFLKKELLRGEKLSPFDFETKLGTEIEVNDKDKIKLVGQFDRIDFNEKNGAIKVIDYKTGNVPDKNDLRDGISLQLPLYLKLCADNFREKHSNLKLFDAEFF